MEERDVQNTRPRDALSRRHGVRSRFAASLFGACARAAFLLLREISFVIMWRGNARGTVNTRDLFPFLCLGPFLPSFLHPPSLSLPLLRDVVVVEPASRFD